MIKALTALGTSLFVSLLVVTGWFLMFDFHGLMGMGDKLVTLAQTNEYWLGIGIFTGLFFIFFGLPLTFMIARDSLPN